jgi:hypothetical protein
MNTQAPGDDSINASPTQLAGAITPSPQIWVAHIKSGRSYVDKHLKASSAEQQVRALNEYRDRHFTSTERFALSWMFCQRPIIQIGTLSTVKLH